MLDYSAKNWLITTSHEKGEASTAAASDLFKNDIFSNHKSLKNEEGGLQGGWKDGGSMATGL